MSSTLAREFENKLIVALKDARVAVLHNQSKTNGLKQEKILEEVSNLLVEVMNGKVEDDLHKQYKATVKAIAMLLNYQIKFL